MSVESSRVSLQKWKAVLLSAKAQISDRGGPVQTRSQNIPCCYVINEISHIRPHQFKWKRNTNNGLLCYKYLVFVHELLPHHNFHFLNLLFYLQ